MALLYRQVILGAACCTAALTSAVAQTPSEEDELAQVYGDKSTISLATGTSQSLRRAPAVASVITAQDIALMGATDLDQVLATVPGIHVGRNNQGYNPLYIVRGIYSEFNAQTLVLYNGVPMTSMFIGNRGTMWSGLPVANIARVEVIRGPGSALYGADAYAGVINIVTKGPADTAGAEIGLRAGSFGSRDGWAQYGGTAGPLAVSAYLRAGHTDGFKETVQADAQTGLDTAFGTHASLAPGPVNTGYDAVDGHVEASVGKLRLRAGYLLRDNVGTGAGAGGALDPVGKGRNQRWTASASLSELALAPQLLLNLTGSYFELTNQFKTPLQIFPPGSFGGSFPNGVLGAPNTWERQTRVAAVLSYGGWVGHQWRAGVGHDDLDLYRTQEFKNFTLVDSGPMKGLPAPLPGGQLIEFPVDKSFVTPQRRHVTYAYAQDEWSMAPDWTLTAGVRRDHYSDFGTTTNPRMALVWDASLDLTAKLLVGRAFRAPSFSEEYSINNPVMRGNPALKPEHIRTAEAVISWQMNSEVQLQASAFRYTMTDIIRAASIGGGTSEYTNAGTQRGHGFELELVADVARNLRLAGHYAYQRALDESTGRDAGYAPHKMAYVRADWHLDTGWAVSGQVKRVADRLRAAGDTRPTVPDYTTVDLTLRTALRATGWDLSVSVRNLFDADVREPSLPSTGVPYDLPMAGRSLDVQLAYRF
ncbi:TonB-dependent receptor plug domain-containing protein [Roseateles cellulosilyticus]|uniref:TonB-dependent receptor n=1 Tax=Pelomonas cellulosilytica TaxID=2906762 RepID=A0ABS8XY79_9BURK|nr:TonB-dependent receptor [Pelomonas sp. P8]MCE4557599.1 TonB-dependent receptor [Pelomonas sp. P8]